MFDDLRRLRRGYRPHSQPWRCLYALAKAWQARKIKKLAATYRLVCNSAGISAIILITAAILSPNGITFIEPSTPIKIFETGFSVAAVAGLTNNMVKGAQ